MANHIFKARKFGQEKIYTKDTEQLDLLTKLFSTQISSRIRGASAETFKPLAKTSVENYVRKLNRLSTLVQNKGWNGDPNFLLNFENVKSALIKSGLESPKDYISPIIKLMKYYNLDNDIIAQYQHLLSDFKAEETKKRGDNLGTKKQEELSMPVADINKKIDAYIPQDDTQLVFKMLCMLYFQNDFTPRLEDIPLMKLVNIKKKPTTMNKDFNYITTTGDNGVLKVKDIIMNNYKSKETYGQVRFPIKENVAKVMNVYLTEFKKQNGDYFILNSKTQPYLIQTFSALLADATEKVLGKPLNVNTIRRLKITDFYRSGTRTINEEEENAKQYLHNASTHKQYLSVNFKE